MSTSQTSARENGKTTNQYHKNEWALRGIDIPEISYEDNFEADISLISANDSGYFSGDGLESSAESNTNQTADVEGSTSPYAYTQAGTFSDIGYADTAASVKSNHGSIYDGVLNESTQLIPSSTHYDSQATITPKSHPSPRNYENVSQSRKYARFSNELAGPSPLEQWQQTYARHEYISTQFQQPAKRHKAAASAKQ